jgi:multidrug efflux pump subunit AcrB
VERQEGGETPTWWARPRRGAGVEPFDDDVRAALGRREVGRVAWAGVEPPIVFDPGGILPERIPLRGGVPLVARARLEPGGRTGALTRIDSRPAERLRVELPRALDPLDLVAILRGVPEVAGEVLRPGGEAFELARSFRQLAGTLALSALLVFLAVAALFESLRLPWIVLATVPVALAGAGAALVATGGSLNLMSFLGLVVLVGIVVNNSIVLLHRAEEEARAGASRRAAALTAAAERYRPILLTTLTTISGLVPLALLGGEGVALRRALATTIVGGLVAGLLGSLLLIPVLWQGASRQSKGASEAARPIRSS